MTNIKALDRLRRAVKKGKAVAFPSGEAYYDAIGECVDAIESEVAERFIELPVDAEGVPWHVGDVTENGNVVRAITFDRIGAHFTGTVNDIDPSIHTHFEPRTIEDALRDLVDDALGGTGRDPLLKDWSALVARYADEIRELIGE